MGRARVERQHTGAPIIVLRRHRNGLHVRAAQSVQLAGKLEREELGVRPKKKLGIFLGTKGKKT